MKKFTLVFTILIIMVLAVALVGCSTDNKGENVTKYTVTFDYDFEFQADKVFVEDGKRVTPIEAKSREGYAFVEWRYENKKFDFDTPITGNIILKAVWEKLKAVTIYIDGTPINKYIKDKSAYLVDDFGIVLDDFDVYGFEAKDESGAFHIVDLNQGVADNAVLYADLGTKGLVVERMDGKNEAQVVRYEGTSKVLAMPDYFEGLPVTEIATNAISGYKDNIDASKPKPEPFAHFRDLDKIVFSANLTTLRTGAISEINLKSLTLPSSIKVMETLSISNANIDNIAFANSSIEKLPQSAINGIHTLTSLTLPRSITSLERATITGCFALAKVYVPNSVVFAEKAVFEGCVSLETIYREQPRAGVEYNITPSWNLLDEITNKTANVVMIESITNA